VAIAREYAAAASDVLDTGTGGGEVYARIVDGLTGRFVATEEWVVNAPVAARRLAPLGAQVVRADSERPPFANGSFDLVINRHEAAAPAEIDRMLRPGGTFITQQVANRHCQEIAPFFPRPTIWPDHFVLYGDWFRDAGYDVETRTHEWPLAYAGIGEIAFMLMIAPWEVPDFDPIAEVDALLALEEAHRTDDGIVLTADRYLMIARKP
jgi:SAM-dependent methyltransferase